jgi:hypothetical protein
MADELEPQRREYVNKQIAAGSTKTRKQLRQEFDDLNVSKLPIEKIIERIKEKYPSYSFLLEGDAGGFGEDVKNLFIAAISQEYTEQQFEAKKRETNYWKTTNNSAQRFDSLSPAEQESLTLSVADAVREEYGNVLGDEATFMEVSKEAARLGLRGPSLRNYFFGAAFTRGKAPDVAMASDLATEVNDLASKYLLKSVPETIKKDVLSGKTTIADVENVLRAQTKTLYPHFSDLIDRGLSLDDIASPYKRVIAQELETDEQLIDMSDSKYSMFLDTVDGTRRYTPTEVRSMIRKDPAYGWEFTEEANNRAQNTAFAVVRAFGKVK